MVSDSQLLPSEDIIKDLGYCDPDGLENLDENINTFHGLKCLHINIQSLPSKFDKLKDLLGTLKSHKFDLDCILVCETFLKKETADFFNLPGYTLVHKGRINKKGGGVGIYIANRYKFQLRDDLSHFIEGEFESIFIELNAPHKVIIGEIYRVPNTNITRSISLYEEVLDNLRDYHCPILIGTDQNFDLLKSTTVDFIKKFLDTYLAYGLYPSIKNPTRITHATASLIDNLYINPDQIGKAVSGILRSDISDHFPIFIKFEYDMKRKIE